MSAGSRDFTKTPWAHLMHRSIRCATMPSSTKRRSNWSPSLNRVVSVSETTGLAERLCHSRHALQVSTTPWTSSSTCWPQPAVFSKSIIRRAGACHKRTCSRRRVRQITTRDSDLSPRIALPMSHWDHEGPSLFCTLASRDLSGGRPRPSADDAAPPVSGVSTAGLSSVRSSSSSRGVARRPAPGEATAGTRGSCTVPCRSRCLPRTSGSANLQSPGTQECASTFARPMRRRHPSHAHSLSSVSGHLQPPGTRVCLASVLSMLFRHARQLHLSLGSSGSTSSGSTSRGSDGRPTGYAWKSSSGVNCKAGQNA